jgi:D-arabinose 1-dehydrogenase-like Zn-dependent alcohol dehydrogenase
MALMKAVQVNSPGAAFELVHKEIPEPRLNEVRIRVQACGVCHGDVIAKQGLFPGIVYPRVPGHEVVGIIDKLGLHVEDYAIGDRVGVGWHAGHCFHCSPCHSGDFGSCENSLTTGLSVDGGYAEYMIARTEALTRIPTGISSVAVAPLLCAGRTTFGALQSSGAQAGDLVAIQGLGGLGHLAVQFAAKSGLHTAALSRGTDKKELSHRLGAHHYIDVTASRASEELRKLGGAKVILCTAPNGKAISELLGGLCRDGRLIIVSGASDPIPIPPMMMLGNRLSISGFVGGSIDETIRFSTRFGVNAMVEEFALEEAPAAYEKMMAAKVLFRAVLKIRD